MPVTQYVLIAVALNAALTPLDGDWSFSDGLACTSSGKTLLRAARKLGGRTCGTARCCIRAKSEATRAHREFNNRYSYNNDFLKKKLTTNLSRVAVAVRTLQPC
jgi:hypothetical protein